MDAPSNLDGTSVLAKGFPKRLLIKVSGESLKGAYAHGVDFAMVTSLVSAIKKVLSLGHEVALVVGGGNFYRGSMAHAGQLSAPVSDSMGMLATMMNGLALHDVFSAHDVPNVVISGFSCDLASETFDAPRVNNHLTHGRVVIFVGGLGCSYFTTDTAAVIRALECKCDLLLKATQVDGVYDMDPKHNPSAIKFDQITYAEVMRRNLRVMDPAAIAVAQENNLDIVVFSIHPPKNLLKLLKGEGDYTLITNSTHTSPNGEVL